MSKAPRRVLMRMHLSAGAFSISWFGILGGMLREKYAKELSYIDQYWDKVIFEKRKSFNGLRNLIMRFGYIKLPYAVVSPNHAYFAETEFYWDSYFMLLGLYDSGRKDAAKGLIKNNLYLLERYGIILARNSLTSLGRTQPSFLTSMLRELESHDSPSEEELDEMYQLAEREYHNVWMSPPRFNEKLGLSRYHPKLLPSVFKVFESGWDLSSRFEGTETEIYPVDLNCMLYQYETDFERHAKRRGEEGRASYWRARKAARRKAINTYLWDADKGFYFDYRASSGSRSDLMTVAGFFPLWCGVASKTQAKHCTKQLPVFECMGGLATTEKLPASKRQWDYPNGWANLHLIVVEGLFRYGYEADAVRVASKWLELISRIFRRTGQFWEKYDVVKGAIGRPGRYPTAPGFGWTNAVFSRMVRLLDDLE